MTVGGLVAGQIFFFCACVFAISLNMPGDALPAVALSGSPERKLSSRRRGAAPKFTGGTTGHLRRHFHPPPHTHPNSPASTRSGDHEDAGCLRTEEVLRLPRTSGQAQRLRTGLEAGQRNAEPTWMEARHSAVDPPQVSWKSNHTPGSRSAESFCGQWKLFC